MAIPPPAVMAAAGTTQPASLAPSLISGGASILGGAFGSSGGQTTAGRNRDLRTQYKMADKYRKRYDRHHLSDVVRGAKKAGLHPLFALGASQGSSPTFSMQGQSARGGAAQDALQGVAQAATQHGRNQTALDIVEAQNMAAALRIAENNTSNDTAPKIVDEIVSAAGVRPTIDKNVERFKPGDVGPWKRGQRSSNLNSLSPMTTIRIGSQNIEFAVEEASDLMEDPVANIVTAMAYRGNVGVDWRKAVDEFTGRPLLGRYDYSQQGKRKVTSDHLWGLIKTHRYWKRQKSGPK